MSSQPSRRPRTVVITGASLGVGKAVAAAFVANGDHVVITARTGSTLTEAATELKAAGPGTVLAVVCDVTTAEGRGELVKASVKETGTIDVLVNNAGVYGPIGPLEDNDGEEWSDNIEVNLIAPALLMKAVVPLMRKAGRGKIINMSGGGATKPTPTFSAYAAAKAGLVRLTETLAYELKPYNIQVNALAPGFIATRFHEPVMAGSVKVDPAIAAQTRKNVERGGDDPQLAAKACLFLASPESDHISGRLLSAVFDDENLLRNPETFQSDSFGTLRRVDNMFIFDGDRGPK